MPTRPDPEALALGRRYRLATAPRPRGGRLGEVRGTGVGSSLEFEDRRTFLPGDDLRRLDWRALARTDRMLLRQHREEVAPALELVLDGSRSMATQPEKAQRSVDLAALLLEAARGEGWRARVTLAGERGPRPLGPEGLLEGVEFEGRGGQADLQGALAGRAARGSLVILVSDLLFPGPAAALVSPLAARSGRLALLQVLGPDDLDPPGGAARLIDAESGQAVERTLDRAAILAYQSRLAAHVEEYALACRRVGALLVRLSAARPLAALAAEELIEAGLLVPTAMAVPRGAG